MEIDLEIVYYGTDPYLRVRVSTESDGASTSISLKELKQALEAI